MGWKVKMMRLLFAFPFLLAAACGDGVKNTAADAGAGRSDGGLPDAGPPDTGPADTGVIPARGPLNPNGDLRGVFLDPLSHMEDGSNEIEARLEALRNSGYMTVIIPYLTQLDGALYPSSAEKFPPYRDGLGDWVGALLDAAGERGMEVWLGLARDRRTAHAWDADPASAELERLESLASDLEARYGANAAFAGLYLHFETPYYPDDEKRTQTPALIKALSAYLHELKNDRKLAVRIRYPGMPLSNFMDTPILKWTTPDEIDDRKDLDQWAEGWMKIAAEAPVEILVVEAQNGAARFSSGAFGRQLRALERKRGASTAGIVVMADLWAAAAPPPGKESVRAQPLVFEPPWETVRGLKAGIPPDGVMWGFDERSLFPDVGRPSDQGIGAAVRKRLRDSAEWVENHLERCCVRDGNLVTVADVAWDIDRMGNVWQEDACWLTGLYLSALTYKAVVTGDERTRRKAAYYNKVILKMARTTPLFGEVVRNFVPYLLEQNNPVPPGSDTIKRWHKHPSDEIYWVGDISVDQMSGWLHGVATYHDLMAAPEEKTGAAEVIDRVTSLIIENGMRAKEWNGLDTTYGNFNIEQVLSFDLLSIAYRMTGKQTYRDKMTELAAQGFTTGFFRNMAVLYDIPGQANGQHFVDSAYYHTLMYGYDPEVFPEIQLMLQYTYQRSFDYDMVWGNMNHALFDPKSEGLTRGIRELYLFEPEFLENRRWFASVNRKFESGYVPREQRPAGEFEWETRLDGNGGFSPRGGVNAQYTGVGYLIAYWLGRYHGLIPGE
jgi:hypothetical protein